MKSASRSALLLCCVWMLAACGPRSEHNTEPPPVEETVFGDLVGSMEKARGVETALQEDKQALDRALEAAEDQL